MACFHNKQERKIDGEKKSECGMPERAFDKIALVLGAPLSRRRYCFLLA